MKRLLIALMAAIALPAAAQNYPTKTVRIIAPFAAGGGIDVLARQLAQKLNESYGQHFIVENKAGATGTLAGALVAKSPPDGYTLILHSSSTYIAPHLYRKVPYDGVKGFAPIVNCVMYPFYIVATPSLPARNIPQVIALAKKYPGQLAYATPGYGSGGHLVMEMLDTAAKIKLMHVPYKGSAAWVAAVAGGEVALGITSILTAEPLVKAGKLRSMAVTSAHRSPAVPDVPTMIESGLPGFEANLWAGLFATGGTPAAIVNELNASITRILATPEMKDWLLKSMGGEFTSNSPERFSEFLARDSARWEKVIKDNNVHLD